ncbi:MAG: DUF58 domain-containing protein [Burkholderiaceae bacterium]|nr:DUF58 domain-containing protein [Burkholderiaceae bacterium]
MPAANITAAKPYAAARRLPWGQRWRRWWLNRHPASDQTTLTHRNLYILPTRAGWMLALTLLLLLVGSINYQLNLGYLLTFLIAGCAVIGMHVAHNNLRGLQLNVQPGDGVFAGQAAAVRVQIHNPSRKQRYGIGLDWWGLDSLPDATTWADAPPTAAAMVQLQWPTTQRGQWPIPPVQVETRFPLGTFRVWHWWKPAARVWVYPAPETPSPPLPWHSHLDDGPAQAQNAGARSDEVDGLRPYRRGDPLKWVAWKKAARLGQDDPKQWASRDFSRPSQADLWLDAAQCGLSDPEGQRSRLCAWVLQAEQMGLQYGLRLGQVVIAPGQGAGHQQRCLEALACH